MKKTKTNNMWQYYVILCIGMIFFVFAVIKLKSTLSFLKTSEKTLGTVASLKMYDSSEGEVYSPVFTFRTRDNIEYSYELPEGTNPSGWAVGETEVIIYDVQDPSTARLFTYFRFFIWEIILFCISISLLIIGSGYFIFEYFIK